MLPFDRRRDLTLGVERNAFTRISSGSNATATVRRAPTSANGSTTSARRPAACSTASKRRAPISARAPRRCRSSATTTIWRSTPKGAATCVSSTAASRPAKTRKKAAPPRRFITPKPDGRKPPPSSIWSWCRQRPTAIVFVLIFSGAPLPKAELTIIGPSKWEKPLVTDEQGRVTLPTPWAGRYVLEVTHFDEKAGGSGEEKFNRTRHISSLSFVQQNGIRWTAKP